MIKLGQYKQGDTLWGDLKMGGTNLTLRDWGCLVSSVASALSNYAIQDPTGGYITSVSPGELTRKLNAINGFDIGGNLDTGVISKLFPALYRTERVYTSNYPQQDTMKQDIKVSLKKIRTLLACGFPVILHVDFPNDPIPNDRPDHFVVMRDWDDIMDPATGTFVKLTERYGQHEKAIFGYLAYIGPTANFPDWGKPDLGVAVWKAKVANDPKVDETKRKVYLNEIADSLLNMEV